MSRQKSFFEEGQMEAPRVDPVSGNEVPPGSLPEEVRDDVSTMLSEGEYVVPADVVRFFGVNFFEQLRDQAKEGMSQMVADDRIGGQDIEPQETPQYAEGGLVQQPTFNPNQWNVLGANVANQNPTGGYEYKQYYGPDGTPMMVLFVNGIPAQSIPEGYSETKPEPKATEPQGVPNESNRQAPTGMTGSTVPRNTQTALSGLDFSKPESILEWSQERLSAEPNKFVQAGISLGGAMLGGPAVGMGAGRLYNEYSELKGIQETRAAASYAEALGNSELADQLRVSAQEAEEDFGLRGLVPEEMLSGDELFERYLEETGKTLDPMGRIAERTGYERVNRPAVVNQRDSNTVVDDGVTYRNEGRDDDDDPETYSTRIATGSTAPTVSVRPQARPQGLGMHRGGLVTRPSK